MDETGGAIADLVSGLASDMLAINGDTLRNGLQKLADQTAVIVDTVANSDSTPAAVKEAMPKLQKVFNMISEKASPTDFSTLIKKDLPILSDAATDPVNLVAALPKTSFGASLNAETLMSAVLSEAEIGKVHQATDLMNAIKGAANGPSSV